MHNCETDMSNQHFSALLCLLCVSALLVLALSPPCPAAACCCSLGSLMGAGWAFSCRQGGGVAEKRPAPFAGGIGLFSSIFKSLLGIFKSFTENLVLYSGQEAERLKGGG